MKAKKSSLPSTRSSGSELKQFLATISTLPQRSSDQQFKGGRLIFALDATASRQPSWNKARELQNQMFNAASQLGGIQVQLCYYRGFNEFYGSPWLSDTQSLQRQMSSVQCLGGYTQLGRVLDHCLEQQLNLSVQAVILIADAVEESVDKLCSKAGKLGLLGVPLFMFQEGHDEDVRQCFQQMAHLSKGAYATFDENSASQLVELLSAAATFASGGYQALRRLHSQSAKQLLQQIRV